MFDVASSWVHPTLDWEESPCLPPAFGAFSREAAPPATCDALRWYSNRVTQPPLSIVILSHNREDILQEHLELALRGAQTIGGEVIVLDNASTDKSRAIIADLSSRHPELGVMLSDANLGVAGGRNAGIALAKAPLVLSLDDDAQLDADGWPAAIIAFRDDPLLGVLAPRVIGAKNAIDQGYTGEDLDEIANFHGAGHFIRVAAFDAVGKYDEYCKFGGEELDLSMRLRSAGFTTRYTDRLTVLHANLVRVGPVGMSRRLRWAQSYAYVFAKNLDPLQALLLSWRRLVSYSANIEEQRKFAATRDLLLATLTGLKDGRNSHSPMSREASDFYRNPHLKPEFGNASLSRKAMTRLKQHGRAR
jgi:GT2 family glycosyltransferase